MNKPRMVTIEEKPLVKKSTWEPYALGITAICAAFVVYQCAVGCAGTVEKFFSYCPIHH